MKSPSNSGKCSKCGIKLDASNRIRAYAGYRYNQCAECRRKYADGYAKRRAQRKKEGRFF